ncbi:hypothetical protein GWL_35260 [Herbaspirillum sp. GW103]|nr:hypothetical protein GWL_35260 [Herbaspirillum sp. GW103]
MFDALHKLSDFSISSPLIIHLSNTVADFYTHFHALIPAAQETTR